MNQFLWLSYPLLKFKLNHEDLCIEFNEGLWIYALRTHAPPTALILFSAVDVNNLAFTTIGIF